MRLADGCTPRSRRDRWLRGGACAAALVTVLAGCSSTNSTAAKSSTTDATIPQSAFSDHTGVTPTSVSVANITTEIGGLFEGAVVGTQAYADYVNAQGGINGRKLIVDGEDDGFSGATNKDLTEQAIQRDFATVGSFSLEDGYGGAAMAANPQVPNVSEVLDPATAALPNSFDPIPNGTGWPLGPLVYFKQMYPQEIAHVGTIVADLPSTEVAWNQEKAAMEHVGYTVLYDPSLPATTTDFNENVLAMKSAGVQIVFLEQEPESYTSAVFKAFTQQDFHPTVVLGGPSYSESLVTDSGGPAATDGTYLWQFASLYLGEDAGAIPAVDTFNTWVQKASPGFKADYFTLYGWLCAELFADALRNAGSDPSRGSELQALRQITSFSAGNLITATNPAQKESPSCYLIARITDGRFQRLDDPPVDGPTHGFRCDQPYYSAG